MQWPRGAGAPVVAISIVATATNTNNGGGGAFSINKPTGTLEGMVMVAFVTSTTPASIPTGWTVFRTNSNPSNPFESRFITGLYKVAGASEPSSYQFTGSGFHDSAGGVYSLGGVDTDNPLNASSLVVNTTAGTSLVLTSITTTENNCLLLGSGGGADNNTWTTGVMSETWDIASTPSSAVSSVAASESFGAAGATGTRTFTLSTSLRNAGILSAWTPAGGGWVVGRVEFGDATDGWR